MLYTAKELKSDIKGATQEKKRLQSKHNILMNKTIDVPFKIDIKQDTQNFINPDANIKAVGNCFNYCDSYMDVLTPKSCNRTLKNNMWSIRHLKDHFFSFDGIIGDMKSVYVADQYIDNLQKTCQCLMFESVVDAEKFPYYSANQVNQHSIGFNYKSIKLIFGDEEVHEDIWQWAKNNVINFEKIEDQGYFWKVDEIELYEISAVLVGANPITPVIADSGKATQLKNDSVKATQQGKQVTMNDITNIKFNFNS